MGFILTLVLDNTCVIYKFNCSYIPENFPHNPNDVLHNVAGICNEAGNVFGMMPYPERVFYKYTYPDWMRENTHDWMGDGKAVFESVIEYTAGKF